MESKNKITKGFPIEICTNMVFSEPSVFKIHFGKKYLIWKGMSLFQSVELVAKSIMARLRNGNKDETNFMYHVVEHIKKNAITKGECLFENIFNDYLKEDGSINGYKMLIDEQLMLDKSKRSGYCLNNNLQAYVPENTSYISNKDKQRFLIKYEKTHK